MNEQSAFAFTEEIKRRIIAMVETRPYRFLNSSRPAAKAYLDEQSQFVGCSAQEIEAVEALVNGNLPLVFRTYLQQMGKRHGGLFEGSDDQIAAYSENRVYAEELIEESSANRLPPNALVFLMHQGYTFLYLLAAGGFDGPVFQYTEGKKEAVQIASSFVELVRGEIDFMESNHRKSHEMGGYFVTPAENGGATETHPALSSGDRPLDQPDRFID